MVKNLPANSGDLGSISGSKRFPGVGNGNLLQYPVHGVTRSPTQLSVCVCTHTCTHTLFHNIAFPIACQDYSSKFYFLKSQNDCKEMDRMYQNRTLELLFLRHLLPMNLNHLSPLYLVLICCFYKKGHKKRSEPECCG